MQHHWKQHSLQLPCLCVLQWLQVDSSSDPWRLPSTCLHCGLNLCWGIWHTPSEMPAMQDTPSSSIGSAMEQWSLPTPSIGQALFVHEEMAIFWHGLERQLKKMQRDNCVAFCIIEGSVLPAQVYEIDMKLLQWTLMYFASHFLGNRDFLQRCTDVVFHDSMICAQMQGSNRVMIIRKRTTTMLHLWILAATTIHRENLPTTYWTKRRVPALPFRVNKNLSSKTWSSWRIGGNCARRTEKYP